MGYTPGDAVILAPANPAIVIDDQGQKARVFVREDKPVVAVAAKFVRPADDTDRHRQLRAIARDRGYLPGEG